MNIYAHKHRNTWYAKYNKTFSSVKMHRLIMNASAGVQVDHANGDGLDNRRSNLRLCTHVENMHNSGKYKNNTSGFILKKRRALTMRLQKNVMASLQD